MPSRDRGGHNLPVVVRSAFTPTGAVLTWSSCSRHFHDGLLRWSCARYAVRAALVPCCWPVALLGCPCIALQARAEAEAVKQTYWILTEAELVVVTLRRGSCMSRGDMVQIVPLSQIVSVDLHEQDAFSVPVARINVAGDPSEAKALEAVGLADLDEFVEIMLKVRGQRRTGPRRSRAKKNPLSTAERIQELDGLRESGIIDNITFEARTSELLRSQRKR